MIAALAVGIAGALELAVSEPPHRVHPVAHFGRAVAPLDRGWSRPRSVGLLGAAALPMLAGLLVATTVRLAGLASPWLAAVVAGCWLFVATSLRMLLSEARSTVAATDTDLDAARSSLRALAGRDAGDLSAGQVRSAAVESAAENLADGLVAPLGGFVAGVLVGGVVGAGPILALALGTGAAAWVKAVNTLDSMLGYHSKPVGWAPARLDDLVMWLPARASALVLAAVARDPGALVKAWSWLGAVPSPNSGWPMGTIAAAHDSRLEKPGVYTLPGGQSLPSTASARRAIGTVGVAGLLVYLLAFAASAVAAPAVATPLLGVLS